MVMVMVVRSVKSQRKFL